MRARLLKSPVDLVLLINDGQMALKIACALQVSQLDGRDTGGGRDRGGRYVFYD